VAANAANGRLARRVDGTLTSDANVDDSVMMNDPLETAGNQRVLRAEVAHSRPLPEFDVLRQAIRQSRSSADQRLALVDAVT